MNQRTMRFRGSVLLLLLFIPGAGLVRAIQQGPPPAPVYTDNVREEPLQEMRRVSGALRAVHRASIATIEPGRIMTLSVREGDPVQEGDVLAELDTRRLKLEKTRLESMKLVQHAVVAARQSEQAWRRSDLDMQEAIAAREAGNPKELNDARSAFAIAQARLTEAEQDLTVIDAQLGLIQIRIEDAVITAPFDGIVIERLCERGEWVGEGGAIVELISAGQIDAWLDVPQQFRTALGADDATVQIMIDANRQRFTDLVPTIVPIVQESGRSFAAYAHLEDTEGALAPGMSVTGWVPTGRSGTFLTISRDALLRNDVGFYVYAARPGADGGSSAMPTAVDVLFEVGERAVIRAGGLQAGDAVVVEGNERLFPTAPIQPTDRMYRGSSTE